MNNCGELTEKQFRYVRLLEEKGRELNRRWTTVQAYRGHLVRYMRWIERNETRVGGWPSEAKVSMYLRKLSVKDRVSPTTRNQAFCALLFFYDKVLGCNVGIIEKIGEIPKAKGDKHLPAILDGEQALAVIEQIEDSAWTPFRLMALLLFGCGLRIAELHNLRHKDVSIRHSLLMIRNTKGRADRRVPLPCCVSTAMERQLRRVELLWEEDQQAARPVSMPGLDGLRRKDSTLPFTLGWQYVFSQQTPCRNPQAWPGEETVLYRHHLHPTLLQRAVRLAATRCRLEGVLTPHVFRHIFASQHRWNGSQLETIQRLLGHKSIDTTMIYVHEQTREMRSPLDAAVEQARSLPRLAAPALALPFPIA